MDIENSQLVGITVATAIGFVVGLQREWVAGKPIGLRSFVLIGLIGGLSGLFSNTYGAWPITAGLLAITFAVFSRNLLKKKEQNSLGLTTELAALAVFMVGVLAASGATLVAIVIGGAITLLLHWKEPMHATIKQIGTDEFEAIVRFILISMIVLPLLPNQTYGPYDVINPWQIWLMVTLIVGLNLAGYITLKFLSGRSGVIMSGVIGGLISSTATTVSFATRCREEEKLVNIAGLIILIASGLVYVRIIIEVSVVAPTLLGKLLGPIAAFIVLFLIAITFFMRQFKTTRPDNPNLGNPAELSTALGFGLLYSVVLFISAVTNEHMGETMLYPVALLSGLTDIDAVTLSTAQLHQSGKVSADTAWRVIFVASLSNLAFKGGIVAFLGGPRLRIKLLTTLLALVVAGVVGVVLWPT